ncbi:WXG100 family type VII secretion target [Umezawaea sp. Da 62-37]|uniref:WXG100 family type VII secretion target n=1 Tax=Umezawaea sp. Da 62-37 TaxID=3075927 RepID=UPI0028F7345C|nr:WXG100 family type VII secretion target [Umezawaea sp. Da 62-37]WNV90851.1 WXG100 family type VII secretion target [Umezawaea sp. Da 62-37]
MDIKVDFGALEGLAGDIASQASTLQSTLENLKSRLAPAIAQWEGSGGSAYQASQSKWDTSAEDLQQVLAQIGTAVRAANESFQQGEQQNTSRWG